MLNKISSRVIFDGLPCYLSSNYNFVIVPIIVLLKLLFQKTHLALI